MERKVLTIEAGRGVAALLVVLYHVDKYYFLTKNYWSASDFDGIFKFGFSGVEFFFVISGYIMLKVHRDDIGVPTEAISFLKKRFVRIYPFFWIILVLTVGIFLAFPGFGRPAYRDPWTIIQSALLAGLDPLHSVVFVSWTMWHEVLFYTVFALIIFRPRVGVVVFCAWLVACVIFPILGNVTPWPTYLTRSINLLFGFGVASAWVLQRWRIPAPRCALVGGMVLFGAAATATNLSLKIPSDLVNILYGLGSAAMLVGAVEAELSGRLRAPSWLVALGGASYAIYLTHMISLPLAAKLAARTGLTHMLPAPFAVVLLTAWAALVGLAVHHFIEKPVIRGGRALLLGKRPRASDDASTKVGARGT